MHLRDRSYSQRSADELALERRVGGLVAEKITQKILQLGLHAEQASGPPPAASGVYAVRGEFLSIDAGSQSQRAVVGFGKGRSALRIRVQVFEVLPQGRRVVDDFEVEATGSTKPGAVATGPLGAIRGANPAAMILTSIGTNVASEKLSASIEAVADDAASKVVEVGEAFFRRQGWIRGG